MRTVILIFPPRGAVIGAPARIDQSNAKNNASLLHPPPLQAGLEAQVRWDLHLTDLACGGRGRPEQTRPHLWDDR